MFLTMDKLCIICKEPLKPLNVRNSCIDCYTSTAVTKRLLDVSCAFCGKSFDVVDDQIHTEDSQENLEFYHAYCLDRASEEYRAKASTMPVERR